MASALCANMADQMAQQDHLRILHTGMDDWNHWRQAEPDILPDLSHADLGDVQAVHDGTSYSLNLAGANIAGSYLGCAELSMANLTGADLSDADLTGSRLMGTILSRAKLTNATLRDSVFDTAVLDDADFQGALLQRTRFVSASLIRTDYRRSRIVDADFSHATLIDMNLSNAEVGGAILADVDLHLARGLESIVHTGPSSIGIDTIYRSQGKIPESFLRGAGVPENFITFMKSLTGAAFEFYSCFISYSTKDQEFADRLYADLQARGVRCWFAHRDIQGGRKVHEQIDQAIRIYDKLLLILSEASMNSNWVRTEIANARARETQQNQQMLFPISLVPFERIRAWKLFDADTGIDSAREIREYFVPDFSNWKDHDTYARAFEQLVRDLKAGAGKKASVESGP